tara:strand:+ start:1513 stop:1836 length:324 start_codon:yes stop_codon:yes gene_type:complete
MSSQFTKAYLETLIEQNASVFLESEEYEKLHAHSLRRIGFTSKPSDISGCVDRVLEQVETKTVTRIMCNKVDIPNFGEAIQVVVYYANDAPKQDQPSYSSLLKVGAV